MNITTCPTTISLSRPLHARVLDAVGDAFYAWSNAWEERAEKRQRERQLDAIADMNELLLRDIGAPDWLVAQANMRREIERQRLFELHVGARRDLLL
jgi:hypothetical protein